MIIELIFVSFLDKILQGIMGVEYVQATVYYY